MGNLGSEHQSKSHCCTVLQIFFDACQPLDGAALLDAPCHDASPIDSSLARHMSADICMMVSSRLAEYAALSDFRARWDHQASPFGDQTQRGKPDTDNLTLLKISSLSQVHLLARRIEACAACILALFHHCRLVSIVTQSEANSARDVHASIQALGQCLPDRGSIVMATAMARMLLLRMS